MKWIFKSKIYYRLILLSTARSTITIIEARPKGIDYLIIFDKKYSNLTQVYDRVITADARELATFLEIIRFFKASSKRHKSEILVIIDICVDRESSQEVTVHTRQFASQNVMRR